MPAMLRRTRSFFEPARYATSLLLRRAPAAALVLLLLNAAAVAATPAVALAIERVVALVQGGAPSWAALSAWLALMALAMLLRAARGPAGSLLAHHLRERLDEALLCDIFARSIALPLEVFEREEHQEGAPERRLPGVQPLPGYRA